MKKLLVAVAAAVAALAVAAPASAHDDPTAVINCVDQTLSVTYTYSEFPEGSSTVSHETVTANGNVVYKDLDYSFQGDNETHDHGSLHRRRARRCLVGLHLNAPVPWCR